MGIAELVVATAAAVMQAIDTWENFRDRRRAREAYEEELRRAQTSEEVKAEAKQIEDVVPESVLNSIYERINECWTRYDSILRGDFGQEEVDQATRAAIRCWCREVNRIKTVTGKLPDSSGVDFPGKWEQYDCAKRIAAGL